MPLETLSIISGDCLGHSPALIFMTITYDLDLMTCGWTLGHHPEGNILSCVLKELYPEMDPSTFKQESSYKRRPCSG